MTLFDGFQPDPELPKPTAVTDALLPPYYEWFDPTGKRSPVQLIIDAMAREPEAPWTINLLVGQTGIRPSQVESLIGSLKAAHIVADRFDMRSWTITSNALNSWRNARNGRIGPR